MAYQHTHTTRDNVFAINPLTIAKSILAGIGNFFIAIAVANERMIAVERLQSKSDAELAKMGLRREDIARHVFRDTLYL